MRLEFTQVDIVREVACKTKINLAHFTEESCRKYIDDNRLSRQGFQYIFRFNGKDISFYRPIGISSAKYYKGTLEGHLDGKTGSVDVILELPNPILVELYNECYSSKKKLISALVTLMNSRGVECTKDDVIELVITKMSNGERFKELG